MCVERRAEAREVGLLAIDEQEDITGTKRRPGTVRLEHEKPLLASFTEVLRQIVVDGAEAQPRYRTPRVTPSALRAVGPLQGANASSRGLGGALH